MLSRFPTCLANTHTRTHAHSHTHTNAIYPWDSRLYGLIITFICSPPPAPPPCSPVLYLTTCHSTITCRDNWNHATITFVVWLDFMSQAKLSRDNTENPPPLPPHKEKATLINTLISYLINSPGCVIQSFYIFYP